MSSSSPTLKISGLSKVKLQALGAAGKATGITAEAYAERLIEKGMPLEQQDRATTFDELFAPVRTASARA
jgi:hypothetical protein